MIALRLAAIIIALWLATPAFAGPDGSLVGVPSGLLMLSPADDLFATADLTA